MQRHVMKNLKTRFNAKENIISKLGSGAGERSNSDSGAKGATWATFTPPSNVT